MSHNNYPEPDIPVDEAWASMRNLLDAVPRPTSAGEHGKSGFRHLLLPVGAALLVLSVIIYLVKPSKTANQAMIAVHSSQDRPLKDTLSGGATIYLDKYSAFAESIAGNKEKWIIIRGAAYFQNSASHEQAGEHLRVGSINILPVNAALYVSFDSTSSVSMVHVKSGRALLEANGEKRTLEAGQAIYYDEKEKRISNTQQVNVNLFSYASLIFEFNDTPLFEAIKSIEKAYGTAIIIENEKLNRCRITTRFDHKSLKEILDVISYTLNFEYRIDQKTNQVLLTGNGCE